MEMWWLIRHLYRNNYILHRWHPHHYHTFELIPHANVTFLCYKNYFIFFEETGAARLNVSACLKIPIDLGILFTTAGPRYMTGNLHMLRFSFIFFGYLSVTISQKECGCGSHAGLCSWIQSRRRFHIWTNKRLVYWLIMLSKLTFCNAHRSCIQNSLQFNKISCKFELNSTILLLSVRSYIFKMFLNMVQINDIMLNIPIFTWVVTSTSKFKNSYPFIDPESIQLLWGFSLVCRT